jgi:predicted DNA-binding protein
MTVTLELNPEIESRINAKAKSFGKTVEVFLLEIIEGNLHEELETKPFYETATDEEWIAELDSLTIFSDKIPTTWDDSRESIYREREDAQL